jgi:hypothetical protein
LEAGKDLKEVRDLARRVLEMLLSKARSSGRGAGRRGREGKGAPLALLLLAPLLLQPLALAQPYPIDVPSILAFPWEDRLDYSIWVEAKRNVAVIVYANVYVPGQGWSGWEKLWEGRLSAGESKWVDGRDERKPTEPGYYIIWAEIHYISGSDYQMIGGERYYASRDYIVVRKEPAEKAWRECNMLGLNYSLLKLDYGALVRNYSLLKGDYSRLKSDYDLLRSDYSRLEREYRDLNSSYSQLKSDYERLKDSYSDLQSSYRRLEDELTIWRAAGLIALGIAIITAVLAVEGWRRALSLAKRVGPAGKD